MLILHAIRRVRGTHAGVAVVRLAPLAWDVQISGGDENGEARMFVRAAVMAAAVVLGLGWPGSARATMPGLAPDALCSAETARNERLYGIPARLLDSISVVESGRYDRERKATLAWPWTVTAEGDGKYFPTKGEAVAEVKRLKARGVKNIDVGCMQVNLYYHPEAFDSLDEAFDPATNVAYAARFLKGLFGATNHWVTAASYYHSQTPHLAAAYRERLMKVWNGAPGSEPRAVAALPKAPALKLGPTQKPVPSSPQVESQRREWKNQIAQSRVEASQIAAAYRQARLAEYQLRRGRMQDARRASGLSADGY
jgi:hypothetical protein